MIHCYNSKLQTPNSKLLFLLQFVQKYFLKKEWTFMSICIYQHTFKQKILCGVKPFPLKAIIETKINKPKPKSHEKVCI